LGKVIRKSMAGIAILLAAFGSRAANTAPTPTAAEQRLMASGAKIVQAFPSVSGLKAIVADNGREKRLFYVTPDGNSLIVGNVFDSKGINVTTADTDRASIVASTAGVPSLTEAQLQDIWGRAEKLQWVVEGTAKRYIYVIFDPNCPYCHRLWGDLRAAVDSGKVQIRWIPVAILKDDSKALGAAIYGAKNTSQAMSQMVKRELQPVRISDAVNKNLAFNLLLLRDTGYTGVPTILYRQGGKYRTTTGLPTDQELSSLLQ